MLKLGITTEPAPLAAGQPNRAPKCGEEDDKTEGEPFDPQVDESVGVTSPVDGSADDDGAVAEPSWDCSLLDIVVSRNCLDLLRVLLPRAASGGDMAALLRQGRPLQTAAEWGSIEAIAMLVGIELWPDPSDSLPERDSLMESAVKGGHFAVAMHLLAQGAIKKPVSVTTLSEVAGRGFTRCLKLLLESDAAVDSKHLQAALGAAAAAGQTEACRMLVEKGADLDSVEGLSSPILVSAAESRRLETLQYLAEQGADVNKAQASTGVTALIRAAISYAWDIVRYLVDKGADVKLTRTDGDYLDALACTLVRTTNVEVIGALLDAGADVSLLSGPGTAKTPPLYKTARSPAVTRYLLENAKRIDVNMELWFGTALYYCCWWGTPGAVVELLKHKPNLEYAIKVEGYLDFGFTALRLAVYKNRTKVARLLLDAGANVNSVREMDGSSPLHCAVTECYDEMTGLLLEYNADIKLRSNLERTALHLIWRTTPVSLIERLLRRGADIESRDKWGMTPLCVAVRTNNLPVVEYLIDKGADLGVLVHGSGGPLHMACRSSLSMVKLLRGKGADLGLVDPDLGTLLMSACFWEPNDGHDGGKNGIILYLLEECNADVKITAGHHGTALHVASLECGPDVVRAVLERGADPNTADAVGRQAIHLAALRTLDILIPLLDAGADISVRDKLGRNALHVAANSGRVDLVREVVSLLGEDSIHSVDVDGWTPLLWAARAAKKYGADAEGQREVIELLLEHGASVVVAGEGMGRVWTPAEVAAYHHASDEVVNLTPRPIPNPKRKGARLKKATYLGSAWCDACSLVRTLFSVFDLDANAYKFVGFMRSALPLPKLLQLRLLLQVLPLKKSHTRRPCVYREESRRRRKRAGWPR